MLEDSGGELAEKKAAVLLGGAFDAAVAEEGVELLGEGVEIVGESVGEKVALHHLERFSETEEMKAEGDFSGFMHGDAVAGERLGLDFALDASDADIGVEEKNCGIAVEAQRALVTEGVVFGAVAGEIGILDRTDAKDVGEMVDLLGRSASLNEERAGLGDGFSEEIGKLLSVAGTSLKLLAIGAENKPEANMVCLDFGPAGELCGAEDHLHVQTLAGVDDDDDALGLLDKDAVADRGHVGGVVVVAAIGLLHHKRDGETFDKDALGAFGKGDKTFLL